MKVSIRELAERFEDFPTSELISRLVEEAEETETLDRVISVNPWPEEEMYSSSDGAVWAEEQAEAKRRGVTAYHVTDVNHTWDMGMVLDREQAPPTGRPVPVILEFHEGSRTGASSTWSGSGPADCLANGVRLGGGATHYREGYLLPAGTKLTLKRVSNSGRTTFTKVIVPKGGGAWDFLGDHVEPRADDVQALGEEEKLQ